MNPIPISLIERFTSSGPNSMFTPSFSNTSALPQLLDEARPPCLATGKPAPAITNAVAVDILNVPFPSPPVPQVSIVEEESSTFTESFQ